MGASFPESEVARRVEQVLPTGSGLTDADNAQRLVNLQKGQIHFVLKWGKWIVFDPDAGCWVIDHNDVHVRESAKQVGLELRIQAATMPDPAQAQKMFSFGQQSRNAPRIAAMVNLARGVPGVPIHHEELDSDGWLLGVKNGVVDLRTGGFREACPADLMTRQAPVRWDPTAQAPRFRRAMEEWFPDPDLRTYVQRLAGSALVGEQQDHVLVIFHGPGGNGKSTFTRAVQRVLGPYAVEVHPSLLVQVRHKEHDTVKADLFRARLAIAAETNRQGRLAEASVKNLTGGDRIRARRMNEDPWSFDPTHTLWLPTNHLPTVGGRDAGIWRRIRVVKWAVTFEGRSQERDLDATLWAERAGILNWLIDGCLARQSRGLDEPEGVHRATLAYRDQEDILGRFASDVGLRFDSALSIPAKQLQDLLIFWAEEEGVPAPKQELGQWLRENGASKKQRRVQEGGGSSPRRNFWLGFGLVPSKEGED